MTQRAIFQLMDLDVWGNEEEGFEVNDMWAIERFEWTLAEWEDDTFVINELIESGYLTEKARDRVGLDGNERTLYINDDQTGRPLYEIRYQA
jgi:hypothetical protein